MWALVAVSQEKRVSGGRRLLHLSERGNQHVPSVCLCLRAADWRAMQAGGGWLHDTHSIFVTHHATESDMLCILCVCVNRVRSKYNPCGCWCLTVPFDHMDTLIVRVTKEEFRTPVSTFGKTKFSLSIKERSAISEPAALHPLLYLLHTHTYKWNDDTISPLFISVFTYTTFKGKSMHTTLKRFFFFVCFFVFHVMHLLSWVRSALNALGFVQVQCEERS